MMIKVIVNTRERCYSADDLANNFVLFADLMKEFPSDLTYSCQDCEYKFIQTVMDKKPINKLIHDDNLSDCLLVAEKLGFMDMVAFYNTLHDLFYMRRDLFFIKLLDFYGGLDRFPKDLLLSRDNGTSFLTDIFLSIDFGSFLAIVDQYSLGKSAEFTKWIQDNVHNKLSWHPDRFVYKYLSVIWKDSIGSLADLIPPGEYLYVCSEYRLQIMQFILEHGTITNDREKEMLLVLCKY